MTTGYNLGKIASNSEAFTTLETLGLRSCYDSEMDLAPPKRTSFATGGVLNLSNLGSPMPVICGGIDEHLHETRECYRLDKTGQETAVASLKSTRIGAASVSIRNGTVLWVTGGTSHHTDIVQDTTEWLAVNPIDNMSLTTSEGVKLPMDLKFHCLVMLSDNLAILYGGSNYYNILQGQSWTIDVNSNVSWQEAASMSTPRAGHICGVIGNQEQLIVVATGGERLNYEITDDVELLCLDIVDQEYLDVNGKEWESGPRLPIGLAYAASATTSDRAILFVAGGLVDLVDSLVSASIFLFHCHNGLTSMCEWRRQCIELGNGGRYYSLAFTLPPPMTNDKIQSRALSIAAIEADHCNLDSLNMSTSLCGPESPGICHGANNNMDCNYDNGDCCLPNVNCRLCLEEECNCHITGQSHCKIP